ncbi:uncharacterized protein LOC122404103 [Colletes gigas]|uniref:uncharacterized protein LOC122404103 n=1 Tax=Colletes gigas TaxID=935657 RepID=UPI001C9B5662|nr:uncharacterized protein LOC122404103 [Colletes gigas]
MSVSNAEGRSEFDVDLDDLITRFDLMTKAITYLKKRGRAQCTEEILKTRLATVTEQYKEAIQQYLALRRKYAPAKRNTCDFLAKGGVEAKEEEFMEFQEYVATELTRLAAESKAATTSVSSHDVAIELPKQRLPKFGGDPRKWRHFEDLFTSGIINNPRLSDVHRLQYLNACLEDKALAAIAHLEVIDDNFTVAWKTLKEQFGIPRIVTAKLLSQLTKLKTIKRDDLDSLNQVVVVFKQALAALEKQGTILEQRNWLLAHSIRSHLEGSLKAEWERSQRLSPNYPSHTELIEFLEGHARALTMLDDGPSKPATEHPQKHKIRSHNSVLESPAGKSVTCGFCGLEHRMTQCGAFRNLTPNRRYQFIKDSQRCILCLSPQHGNARCPSEEACTKCNGRHHSLLHFESFRSETESRKPATMASQDKRQKKRSTAPPSRPQQAERAARTTTSQATTSQPSTSHCTAIGADVPTAVLLATANVRVYGINGASRIVRALIDQGSESSFISANLTNDLKFLRRKPPATVTGLGGGKTQTIKFSVEMNLGTVEGTEPTVKTKAYIVQKITSYVSPLASALKCDALKDLPLADPDPASGQPIEVLIGADLYAQIIRPGFRRICSTGPVAQETAFGWILSGPTNAKGRNNKTLRTLHCNVLESLDTAIRKFWEVEELPSTSVRTKAEEECETHFQKTVARDATGRFVVRLPFTHPRPDEALGNSYRIALSALGRLRKKLDADQTLVREYTSFLTEYEELGHMTRIEPIDETRLYIPHRAVVRTESATTKLRVVFNATSRTAGGRSLNDILHVGPKLQNDITSVLTRWRLYEYVLVADIEKMFRQILVAPQDRRYQCILWRTPETEQLNAFELNTVTYGTACAPYLSMRTLLELKNQDGHRYPLAAPILERDIYVDDVFMGAPDTSLLEKIRNQVCELLQRGGFKLRKWAGNSPLLLRNIPQSAHSHAVDLTLFDDSELKVLGLRWIPSGDYFYFNLQRFQPSAVPMTKRNLFSEIAKLFDPLGWLSPVVIRAKILMQSQWLEKIQWDDQISANTLNTWNTFCVDWSSLNKLKIPRWINYGADTMSVEIHGFCDASLAAYSAVTYLRVTAMSNVTSSTLIMAKTRVAPIKTQSIPVLELNGAVLLAELIVHVERSLSLKVDQIICWTDSTIALAWLRKHASTWKVLIANRVSKVQTLLPNAEWRHVPTRFNPADLNSRGVEAAELLQSKLWISGPSWLTESKDCWPKTPSSIETEEGKRKVHAHVAIPEKEWELVFRFSTWNKLLRVTAYCLRLRRPMQGERRSYDAKFVEASEMQLASERIVRYIQRTHFAKEYRCLKNHRKIPAKSMLKSLNPFLDDKDVLRVGGRLENTALPWETKHPIILPKHHVSTMIIRQCHVDTLHGGLQLTMYTVRQKFWILGCRNAARTVIHGCMRCVRWRAKTPTQIMQDLIPERCREARAFSNCGVDYAGPFRVRDSAGRGKTAHKAYIAVFVCYATRAIHIELVHDYTTSAFLAALDRFIARRGVPSCIFSDNGTNFVGADRELRENFEAVYNTPEMRNKCSQKGIKWKFNPPSAPHFGGMQEAGVKSMKFHLKRTLGEFTPTSEELQTLLCKIEASLNSRPIAALSDSPDDYAPLTPGHFLVGSPLNALPTQSVEIEKLSRLTRWRAIQKFHEQIWRHWTRDYLTHLQNRYKWRTAQKTLKLNDLVLVQNPLLPPNQWEMGRVEEVFTGRDGNARVVKIRTAKSIFTRPITRLCKLPVEDTESATVSDAD